jgi:hypothetical protein
MSTTIDEKQTVTHVFAAVNGLEMYYEIESSDRQRSIEQYARDDVALLVAVLRFSALRCVGERDP